MRLDDILIAEDNALKPYTDWRTYETAYAVKIAKIKSNWPAFDEKSEVNQGVIQTICRLEHLATQIESYIHQLKIREESLSLLSVEREEVASEFNEITVPLNKFMASNNSVGDTELEDILTPRSIIKLSRVKATAMCIPEHETFYREIALNTLKEYPDTVSEFIKQQAKLALSLRVPASPPSMAALILSPKVSFEISDIPSACCIM